MLIRLSASLGSGSESAWRAEMKAAGQLEPAEVEEILLQSYLFLGFPVVLNAMRVWREMHPQAASETDGLATPPTVEAWTERGERVCRTVYGGAYEKLRANVARLHPALDRWMIAEGYGKVLGRPGVDLATRELCIVALLARQGWMHQLHSHLLGAMHAGAAPEQVDAAVAVGVEGVEESRSRQAKELWESLRGRGVRARSSPRGSE